VGTVHSLAVIDEDARAVCRPSDNRRLAALFSDASKRGHGLHVDHPDAQVRGNIGLGHVFPLADEVGHLLTGWGPGKGRNTRAGGQLPEERGRGGIPGQAVGEQFPALCRRPAGQEHGPVR